jgi:NADH:ubiquinone oxidoreductase subunit 4 (subunit M)
MLWLVLRTLWGPITNEENRNLLDVTPREAFILGTLSVAIFVFGFCQKPIMDHAQATIVELQRSVSTRTSYRTRLVYADSDKDSPVVDASIQRGATQ